MKKICLNIISCILGYSWWHIYSENLIIHKNISVPLCFYNISDYQIIESPEQINISVTGKKRNIQKYVTEELACPINGNALTSGINYIPLSHELFFLPQSVDITPYSSTPLIIKINAFQTI